MGQQIEEVKSIVMIGGLPCLACLISFLVAFKVYPDDGEGGMKLVCYSTLVVTVFVILVLLRRIWIKVKEMK